MPIFQADLEQRDDGADDGANDGDPRASPMAPAPARLPRGYPVARHPPPHDKPLPRKLSDESIRTDLCEGPVAESSPRPTTPENDVTTTCSDRSELIERLKRGESPTWVPNRHFESIWTQHPETPSSPLLLPPPTITPERRETESEHEDNTRLAEGLKIERPRSALHSGDFTHDETSRSGIPDKQNRHGPSSQADFGDSTSNPWLATSPPRDFAPFHFGRREPVPGPADPINSPLASLSSSFSSSFVYKAPTSPLVQSESNDDLDLTTPAMEGIDINANLSRVSRRHTLTSSPFGLTAFSPSTLQRHTPSLRHEKTFPYQAHQPRRSLTSTPSFCHAGSSPQSQTFLHSRRPSFGSDVSPIQHASMVGSYEESILRGRMSTTPSKPLDFVAQIGVLGFNCKASLRCPSHVTLPFPAVFYSYASSSNGPFKMEDGPSPYVGQVDLENGLSNQEDDARSKRKKQTRATDWKKAEETGADGGNRSVDLPDRDVRRPQRQKRRSGSPRAPPGGSYRIPEKGQIQIIIKNPNKTAVKLFLVPYDLTGMEPGTKTFIRQRSYSTGPIIENMPNLQEDGAADRPILRYLIHLHICCPSKGRFYLYKSIRVVFANRVPDGKEKLRNEITVPEPKFTSYKPIRVMHPPTSGGTGPGANLAAEKAYRRRSSGFYFGASSIGLDAAEGMRGRNAHHQPFSFSFAGGNLPVEPIPFRVSNRGLQSTLEDSTNADHAAELSPTSSQASRPTTQNSSDASNWGGLERQLDRYNKLSKGDVGYGGNAFSGLINGSPGIAESLLTQRLRTLGVQGHLHRQDNVFNPAEEEYGDKP